MLPQFIDGLLTKSLSSEIARIDYEATIEAMFKQYYTNLFKLNAQLMVEVSNEEINMATSQLGALKALGPDGFPGIFFQTFWEDVEESVFKGVKAFFIHGIFSPSCNSTLIVRIPKAHIPKSE